MVSAAVRTQDEHVSLSLLDAFELRCDGEPVSIPRPALASQQTIDSLAELHGTEIVPATEVVF